MKWKPKTSTMNVKPDVSMPLGNKSRTTNILESITLRGSTLSNTPLSSNSFAARTIKFRNDQIAPILGYGDLVQGNVTIKRVYYVEGLNYNFNICCVQYSWFRCGGGWKGLDWVYDAGFGSCYFKSPTCTFMIKRDGENLDKMKEKGDACIFRVFYLVKSLHDHVKSDSIPQCPTTALEQESLSPGPQSQENVSQAVETVTTSNELDLLFSLMFDELLNGNTPVVLKSSAETAADTPNQHQQQNTTPSTSNNRFCR
ncbi:hypothetical protein Tco_0899461 [Tanacetum coccineum]